MITFNSINFIFEVCPPTYSSPLFLLRLGGESRTRKNLGKPVIVTIENIIILPAISIGRNLYFEVFGISLIYFLVLIIFRF